MQMVRLKASPDTIVGRFEQRFASG